jgi:hypothetical protein
MAPPGVPPLVRPDQDGVFNPVPVGVGNIVATEDAAAFGVNGEPLDLPTGEFIQLGQPLPPNMIAVVVWRTPPGLDLSYLGAISGRYAANPSLILEDYWMIYKYPCWNLLHNEEGEKICGICCGTKLALNSADCQASFYTNLNKYCGKIKHPVGFAACALAAKGWSINCQRNALKYFNKCMDRCKCR